MDYVIKTFSGIELHYQPDMTEQELIEWIQENIEKFKMDRLRELMKYEANQIE